MPTELPGNALRRPQKFNGFHCCLRCRLGSLGHKVPKNPFKINLKTPNSQHGPNLVAAPKAGSTLDLCLVSGTATSYPSTAPHLNTYIHISYIPLYHSTTHNSVTTQSPQNFPNFPPPALAKAFAPSRVGYSNRNLSILPGFAP